MSKDCSKNMAKFKRYMKQIAKSINFLQIFTPKNIIP